MIKLAKLSKKYADKTVVDGLNIDFEAGKIHGILGPNGAGKSTMIKMIVGGVKPTAGSVTVDEMSPLTHRRKVSQRIGYMPQDSSLYGDLSVVDNIRFWGRLHRVSDTAARAIELMILLDIQDRSHDKVADLSGGMQQRVSLACALVHDPDILILDEPTAGLDPELKMNLWAMFRELADNGKCILISTHLMEEALLCDSLVVLAQGRLITTGTPRELLAQGDTLITMTHRDGTVMQERE